MADQVDLLETRTYQQLPEAATVAPDDIVAIQPLEGPLQRTSVGKLFQHTQAVDIALATSAELTTDADAIALPVDKLAMVYADPDPTKSGYYLKTDAAGSGTWVFTDIAYARSIAAVGPLVDEAEAWAENPAGVPVEPGRFSALHHALNASASQIAAVAAAKSFAVSQDQPNAFSPRQLTGDVLPEVLVGGTIAKGQVDGLGAVQGLSDGGVGATGAVRFAWRFPIEDLNLPSGRVVASLKIPQCDAGSAASSVKLIFRSAALATLSSVSITTNLHLAATPANPILVTFPATAVPGGTAFIDLDVDMRKASADPARNVFCREMLLGDGDTAAFRPAPGAPAGRVNHFCDPKLVGRSSTVFQALRTVEAGEPTLALTPGATLRQVLYSFAPGDIFAPGYIARFTAEIFTDATTVNNSADVAWIFYDAAGVEIAGTRKQVNALAANRWHILRVLVLVPAGCARIDLRFTKRVGASLFKLRRIRTISNNPDADQAYPALYATAVSSNARSSVFVGPGGNDLGEGTRAAPLATLTAALGQIGGAGTVRLLPGAYGPGLLFDPSLIQGDVTIVGEASDGNRALIRMTAPLAGVVKTAGRTRIYEVVVPGLGPAWTGVGSVKMNWIWIDDVPDARTLIPTTKRRDVHNGRTHELTCTRIMRASEGAVLATALDEMEAATVNVTTNVDGTPGPIIDARFFYDTATEKLYFTVPAGVDALTAAIHLPNETGLIGDGAHGANGILKLRNVELRYGKLDLTSFAYSEISGGIVLGSYANAIEYNRLLIHSVEVAGFGSFGGFRGDGVNGHDDSDLTYYFIYGHHGRDDVESCHQNGRVRGYGGYASFIDGTFTCPAAGADARYWNLESYKCALGNVGKLAAFQAAGWDPAKPADGEGVDTNVTWTNCHDDSSRRAFAVSPATNAHGRARNCSSSNPTTEGWLNVEELTGCTGEGLGLVMTNCSPPKTLAPLAPLP